MAKSTAYEGQLLALLFNATSITGVAQNIVSSPLTQLFVALHTADPSTTAGAGTLGTQNASECTYTGYARTPVNRNSGGWTVGASSVSPATTISFPIGSGGSGTATFASIGAAVSGATEIFYSGALNPSIVTGNLVTPQITTSSTITEV